MNTKQAKFTLLSLCFLSLLAFSSSVALAQASASYPASGSFIDNSVFASYTAFNGGSEIIYQTNVGTISGTFSGPYLTFVNLTISSTGITYIAIDVCCCRVGGKSGTLVFNEVGTRTLIYGV